MKIVLRAFGGLGNQLFQYAAGKYYARRYVASLQIVSDPAEWAQCYGYARPFLLSNFSIAASIRKRSRADGVLIPHQLRLKPVSARLRKALRAQQFIESAEHRFQFLRDLPLERNIKTLYLEGNFENREIVEENATELRRDLAFIHPPSGKNLELMSQIERSRVPISIHVRRGDATFPAEGKVILGSEYYADAIRQIKERFPDPTFFVFSDDIPFVREHLHLGSHAVFVDHNDAFSAYEDLRLMSACRHHIVANSTFSWWGAWLNHRQDKMVIAPRRWYLGHDNYYPGLFPSGWVLNDLAGVEEFA